MKLFRAAALVTAALMCGATAAVAAPGDAPAGWSLAGSETVRYFLPGSTPPAGSDQADAATAKTISSQNPSSGEWLLVGTDNVKDFIPDSAGGSGDQLTASTFVSTRNEQQTYYSGREKLSGTPTYDQATWETNTKKWRLVSQTATVRRYDVPVYQNVHTPYKIVDRYGYDTRTVDTYDNTYRANKIVKTALGQEIVDTHSYTKREDKASAWARGAVDASMDKLISTGIDDTVKTTIQAYVVDLLAGQVAASDKSMSSKSATFLSDSGSGNTKTALSGSKKRVAFKADEAVVSVSKKVEEKGSIKDLVVLSAADRVVDLPVQAAPQAAAAVAQAAPHVAVVPAAPQAAVAQAPQVAVVAPRVEEDEDEDSTNQTFALSDWTATFQKDNKRVVFTSSYSKPRAALYEKKDGEWKQKAQDTSPPSGSLNSSKSSYSDSAGPAFYTNGAVTLKRKKNGDIKLKGTFKGSWGTFSVEDLKRQ